MMLRATLGRHKVVKKGVSESSCWQSVTELLQANPLSHKFSMFVFLVLFNLIFVTGCTYQVTRYEYVIPKEIEYGWGKAGARLISIGHKSTESGVMTGPPYKLVFWLDILSKVKVNGSATVISVALYDIDDVEDKKLVFKSDEILKSNFEQRTGYYSVNFSFENLELKYVRYKLVLRFKVETDKVTTEDEATFYFEKDFEQYRSIKWWEALKGI